MTASGFEPREYEISVEKAKAHLENADEQDAFLFAVAEDGEYSALLGYNDEAAGDMSLDELIAVFILLGADSHGVHPAYLGHLATKHAVEKYEA